MEGTIAEIRGFGGNFAPRAWAFCQGQLFPISSNTALFSLLGTTYGGDGRTTFALPDLRGRVPIHPGIGPGLQNKYILGSRNGSEYNHLQISQLPEFSQNVEVNINIPVNTEAGGAEEVNPGAGVLANSGVEVYSPSATSGAMYSGAPIKSVGKTAPLGAGMPINNVQPYQVINQIICIQGVFPSRS